jgi:hypothetical protein
MHRKFLISMAVILMLTSGAFANIGQIECFSIGSLNIVGRSGMVGSAKGGNLVIFSHSQKIQKPWFSTKFKQEEKGILVQYGKAQGTGGVSGVAQRAKIRGIQGQYTKPFGLTTQGQCLKVNLGQVALESGGVGSAQGLQGFVGVQSQKITTPHMTSTGKQFVGVGQYASVSGGEGSTGIVVNAVSVEMGQGQVVSK